MDLFNHHVLCNAIRYIFSFSFHHAIHMFSFRFIINIGRFDPKLGLHQQNYITNKKNFRYLNFTGIQRLMGCLLFVKKDIIRSPYCDLFDPWHWSDINDTFTRLNLNICNNFYVSVLQFKLLYK